MNLSLNQSSIFLGEIEERIKRLTIGSLKNSIGKKKTKDNEIQQYEKDLFNKTKLEEIINEIDKDSNYSAYKIKIKKAQQVNETNFFSKQPQLTLESKALATQRHSKYDSHKPKKLSKEKWIKMKNNLEHNKKKTKYNNSKVKDDINNNDYFENNVKEIYFENDLSSEDSYDSDLNPFTEITDDCIKKRTNEIKKNKIKKNENIIKDMKKLYHTYKLISK